MNDMMDTLEEYRDELCSCCDIALRLELLSPDVPGAFTGTPSQRILRQLRALGVLD